MKINLMYNLSSVNFVNQSLHVSGIFVANPANRQSNKLLYIYSIPPGDGLQICPERVEVDRRNKLKINSASSRLSLHGYI
jgi:hypothetical protein